MTTEPCISTLLSYIQYMQRAENLSYSCARRPLHNLPLDQMHIMLSDVGDGESILSRIKQEPDDSDYYYSGGEEKDFSDKWAQINNEKSNLGFNHLEDSQPPHHQQNHSHTHNYSYHSPHSTYSNNIVNGHQSSESPKCSDSPQVPEEANQDSQDTSEGSSSGPSTAGKDTSLPKQSSKESTSFLFVGPLGKKRKYSRQRATSDDNEPESHLPTATGSPETAEEMDPIHSPSPEENSQSSSSRPNSKDSPEEGFDQVATVISRTPLPQPSSVSADPGVEGNNGENINIIKENRAGVEGEVAEGVISRPSPIICAPTSVIRRVNRKKQEYPLPLNLSVSSPPGNANNSCSSSPSSSVFNTVGSSLAGRPVATIERVGGDDSPTTTNPSAVREELYFDGRSCGTGDRPVFVWRYRDDVAEQPLYSNHVAAPMSPLSTNSQTSFAVPDVKAGSSGASSSASSNASQRAPATQYPTTSGSAERGGAGSSTNGKPPKKKLKCNDCGKEFSQLRNYRYHRSRHEGSDQFSCTCPVCGKQFNDRGYLSSHMKIHRNAKEYRCEFCTKGFNQRVAYNMHRRIHTGHRPHQCEVCGKSFSRRMLLKQHMRIHTGERPYSCGVCNKAFADRSNMLLHQRLHSGERPYVCEICKKSFSKNHHLKTHMNHHAGIKPYECPKCHARFSQSSNMKTHLKKCSGIPNPTTSQRQQMLRRNPLDIGRPTAQLPSLPSLPGVVAVAAAAAAAASGREGLPPLSATSRLIYEQQSLSFLSQSIGNNTIPGVVGGSSIPSQLSPGHSRGQVPIENLLLHLNVGRSRHPSQGSGPASPTTSMSFPDLQLMLRNAAAAVSSSGSRTMAGTSSLGHRSYSSPSSPGSSSNPGCAPASTSVINSIPGMATFGGASMNPNSPLPSISRHASIIQGGLATNGNEPGSPSSSALAMNPNLGMVGYGGGRSHDPVDSNVMPPPTSGSVLRSIPTSTFISPEMLSPQSASMLRIDTRGMESYQNGLSPTDKSGRQVRVVPSPLTSPRRKQSSPSSLSAGGSFIPLSTLETAAIASGLRSPSQVVRLLSSALREAENPMPHASNQQPSYTRLPSLSHHNVLEAMVAAAAAEQQQQQQNAAAVSQSNSTRIRQVPSPTHQHAKQQYQIPPQSQSPFQFSGEMTSLPNIHSSSTASHHPSQHGTVAASSPYSVITSTHVLQQEHSSHTVHQSSQPRYSSSGSASTRLGNSSLDGHHHLAAEQQLQQQIELYHNNQLPPQPQQRQHGYHQSLLLSHVTQNSVSQQQSSSSAAGYASSSGGSPSNTNTSNSNYSAFSHSIIRSRSHSPGSMDHLRDRNQDYQN